LKGIPTLETSISVPPVANHIPHLLIRYDQTKVKVSPREVMAELRSGTPCIELNPSTGATRGASAGIPADGKSIVVGVWMLQPGEDLIVGQRLKEVLSKAIQG
jgi:L-seryl-tRNA(Ser) seleniumtransferase